MKIPLTTDDTKVPSIHSPSAWWGLFKEMAREWGEDYVPSIGAALAYYTMFSLAPLLLIVVSISPAHRILGHQCHAPLRVQ